MDCFESLYWICYSTASVLCFGSLAMRCVGSIVAPQPGIKPSPHALESKVLIIEPPEKSLQVDS